MSGKNPLIINIDIETKGRKCEIIENSVASILFQVSDTTTRYVYKIHMRGMRNQSETTEGGLKNLELKKECDLPIKTRTETNQVFELSEKHRGNIMLVEFFKYEGVPVLCAACVLIVKPSKLRIAQVFFKDSTGKEVGCGSVQYEADLKFSLRVKYNRPLLRGEEAPKLKCKGYCTNATTGKYEEISKFSLDENAAYTDTIYCNDGLQESHAGADYVISLGFTDPYKPPFYLENTNKLAPSIQKIHLISRQVRKRQIMSVVWSSKEMIKFGESTTQRKSIDRNEDGFLHIHTRGMYGQKVRIELYEKDSTGIKRLLLGLKNDVTILDNAVCVPIEMSGVYAKAKKGRFFLAEGFSFEIMAKVTPLDTSIAAFEQGDESIELMVYGKADEDKAAKSTVNGTMKFVIKDVDDESTKESIKKCECEERVKAFMRMLRVGEGTSGEAGYETLFGGESFIKDYKKDWSTHPQILISKGKYKSTAAGAYQIMGYTYYELSGKTKNLKTNKYDGYIANKDYLKKYNIDDFSPLSQDLICLVIFRHKRNGILKLITSGKIQEALEKYASYEWASLPPGRYGQPTKTMPEALLLYEKYYKEELSNKSDLHLGKGFLKQFFPFCYCQNDIIENSLVDNDVEIIFNNGVNRNAISASSIKTIRIIAKASNNKKVYITSTMRSAREQAEIMYNQTKKYGAQAQYKLYSSNGDKIIDVYVSQEKLNSNKETIITEMEKKINEIGPSKVSLHCGDHKIKNVFDISSSRLQNPKDFLAEANKRIDIDITKIINESDRGCYHFEILQ